MYIGGSMVSHDCNIRCTGTHWTNVVLSWVCYQLNSAFYQFTCHTFVIQKAYTNIPIYSPRWQTLHCCNNRTIKYESNNLGWGSGCVVGWRLQCLRWFIGFVCEQYGPYIFIGMKLWLFIPDTLRGYSLTIHLLNMGGFKLPILPMVDFFMLAYHIEENVFSFFLHMWR